MKKGKQHKEIVSKQAVSAKIIAANSTLPLEEIISWFLLVCLIFLVVVIRSKFLMMPFERDEGAYSYYGKLFLEGKIPYRDFYEQKFPGIFYFYGLMVLLFGETVKGMHTGFIFINVATIILIYLASRKLFSPIAGLISAITFAFVSLTPALSGFTIQSEHGIALFTSLGLLFYAFKRQKTEEKEKNIKQEIVKTGLLSSPFTFCFLMGLVFGIAFMVKTSGIFFVAWGGLMIVIDFFFQQKKTIRNFLSQVLLYSGGVFIVVFFSLLIIYLKGSWTDMIYWTITIPKKYVGMIPFSQGITFFNSTKDAILQYHSFFWYHALLALPLCLIKGISWQKKIFAFTLIFFSVCPIVPGYYFYGHYWIQILPGLSVLAGLTFYCIISVLKRQLHVKPQTVKAAGYVYLLVFILFTYSNISTLQSYYFHPNYERILRAVYGNNPFPEAMQIGNYINANAKPEDKIIVVGQEPEVYFYTKKESPSRHAYFSPIVDNVPEHHQWQREWVSSVEKASPKYLIFFRHPISLFVKPNTDTYVFDWLNKYIPANYNLVGLVDMIEGQQSVYVWGQDAQTYKPVSQNVIFILERKS